jgi:transcriptional regulator with XRE-family HTH domain
MAISLKTMIAREGRGNRRAIDARAKELIAHETSLRALRKAAGKTQVDVAAALGIKQENVSRIERQADLLLSTLSRYVHAIGGHLRLTAEFAGGRTIELPEFTDFTLSRRARGSAKRTSSVRSRRKAPSPGGLHVD